MMPKDEKKSLIKEPLPVNLSELAKIVPVNYSMVGKDRVLASIVEIDEQVSKVQEILAPFVQYMQNQRDTLMKRAQEEKITQDAVAVLIENKGKQMRNEIEDLEAFELQFPGKIAEIRKEQSIKLAKDLLKKLQNLEDSEVPLGVADDVIGKEKITEFVGYQPVKVTYEVRRV